MAIAEHHNQRMKAYKCKDIQNMMIISSKIKASHASQILK